MNEIKIIGIDALGIESYGGARTSIMGMLDFLIRTCTGYKFYIYLSEHESQLESKNTEQIILPFRKGIFSRLFMQIYLPIDVYLRGIDLIHFTKSQATLIPFKRNILTIHDLTILIHPEIHSKVSAFFWKYIQPLIIRGMDALFTVSNDAADDIMSIYGVQKDKITVIYNRSQFDEKHFYDNQQNENVNQKYNLPKSYFLNVGIIALKKNLATIILAYEILKRNDNDIPPLILVGPRYKNSDAGNIFNLIEDLGLIESIRYLGKIPKDDLYYVFKNASIFLFPSFHEGFGIPCLEAMQLGVPLIASKASAIPEIVGNAGILIEDYMSPQIWANEIRGLINNSARMEMMIKNGFNRYREISSKHSYSSILAIYQKLLK